MSIGKITALVVSGDHRLKLSWDDGSAADIDFSAIIATRKALSSLADASTFAKAVLSEDGWSVEWPTGIDFGAPQLRRWADEQAGQTMSPAAFRAWLESHDFTLDRQLLIICPANRLSLKR
jgi:hypothetical protein